jgi:selenocysteine lyase/cysteine desulfurase
MPLPLNRVGQLCRARGITFVVDGAQGVGHQRLDLREAAVDFMAFSAWKWLMGPLGLGVFYVAREKLETLKPVFWATGSVVDDETYLPYRAELKPDADRFIISTPNFGDWVYFLAALEFLKIVGFERARERIWELNAHLAQGLRQKGFSVLWDQFAEYPTGITVCSKPGLDAPRAVQQLKAQGVIAAERLGCLRLAPHIYNSLEQLDRVVEMAGRL